MLVSVTHSEIYYNSLLFFMSAADINRRSYGFMAIFEFQDERESHFDE